MLDRRAVGSSVLRTAARGAAGMVLAALLATGCSDGGGEGDGSATTLAPGPEGPPADASTTLIRLGAAPGEITSLRAAGSSTVEWVDREQGVIVALDVDDPALTPDVVAEVTVSTRGREWGLIDTVVVGDRRFATWTQPGAGDFENGNLVVGELVGGTPTRVLFNAGRAATAGIAGQLDVIDDRLVLALGAGVGWADQNALSGALLTLDPDGDQDQDPIVISTGYVDPRAFLVTGEEVWVWDRADPPGTGESTTDDVEHAGRADLSDRDGLPRRGEPSRDPTTMILLADGTIGVCGTADGQLRSYTAADGDGGERTRLADGGGPAVMACTSAATVLDDGTIVTVAEVDGAQTLQIRRP